MLPTVRGMLFAFLMSVVLSAYVRASCVCVLCVLMGGGEGGGVLTGDCTCLHACTRIHTNSSNCPIFSQHIYVRRARHRSLARSVGIPKGQTATCGCIESSVRARPRPGIEHGRITAATNLTAVTFDKPPFDTNMWRSCHVSVEASIACGDVTRVSHVGSLGLC